MFTGENLTIIIAILQFAIMMIPIFTLIWRASELNSRLKILEKNDIKQDDKLIELTNETTTSLQNIMSMLNEIKISVARLDERVANAEERDK